VAQPAPFGAASRGDVRAPGVALGRVVLERHDAAAEVADAGAEPERGIAARAANLQYVAARIVRDEPEQEAACGRRDRPGPHLARKALCALEPVLLLEAAHDGEDTIVEHGPGRYLRAFGNRDPDVGAALERVVAGAGRARVRPGDHRDNGQS